MSVTVSTTTALTPLQDNFGRLKARVASYVQGQNLAGVLADAGSALNGAIDELNARNWHWLHKSSDLTVTASTRTITLPADFRRPLSLFRLDSNDKEMGRIDYKIPKVFFDSDYEGVDSTPETYTVVNAADSRVLTFDYAPKATWATSYPKVRTYYYARCLHFAEDGDTLGDLNVPPEFTNFLVWYARWSIASDRGSATQIDRAERAWEKSWFKLVADDNDEQTDWSAYK